MATRKLRIIRRSKNMPVLGKCEFCNMQFPARYPLSGQAEAQAEIQQQFNAHKCEPADASEAAAPSADKP